MHGVALEAPVAATNEPASESLQDVAPRSAAKVPGWHASHCVAPAPEYLPTGHRDCVDAPVALTTDPALALRQLDWPTSATYVPASHFTQGPEPAPLEVPGEHGVHAVAPRTLLS